jgi:hypothetical protein
MIQKRKGKTSPGKDSRTSLNPLKGDKNESSKQDRLPFYEYNPFLLVFVPSIRIFFPILL